MALKEFELEKKTKRGDRLVEVCAECLTASCWHGEFMCWGSRHADVVEKTVSELRRLRREHPSNYSLAKIRRVFGGPS